MMLWLYRSVGMMEYLILLLERLLMLLEKCLIVEEWTVITNDDRKDGGWVKVAVPNEGESYIETNSRAETATRITLTFRSLPSTKQSRSLAFAVPSLSTRIPGQKRCSFVGTTKFTRCWTTLHRRDWERVRLLPPEPGAQYARKNLVIQNPSVATCSKLEWERMLYSFWSFLKGRGAMGSSKKTRFEQSACAEQSEIVDPRAFEAHKTYARPALSN